MADTPTTGELSKAKAILDDEVNVAVDAYLATSDMGPFPIAKGYHINIAAAVQAGEFARRTMASGETTDHLKRAAVRTAILLARPTKGYETNHLQPARHPPRRASSFTSPLRA